MQIDLRQSDNTITPQGGTGGAAWTTLTTAAQAAYGIVAKANVFGSMNTSGALATLFNDSFDTALDAAKWTLSGTTPPTTSGTSAVLSLTAANSVSSSMISIPTFTEQGQPFVLAAQMTLGAQQTNPNVVRLFGRSVVTAFAAATPTTDGYQFEVDVTGALCACVYVAGVRYVVNSTNTALITPAGSWAANMTMSNYGQALTWPTSGTAIVTMQGYSGLVYFFMASAITGMDVPVGVASWQPNVAALPVRIAAISTPVVSTVLATTYTVSGMLLGAIGGTNYTQSDPVYPWRQSRVDALGRSLVTIGGSTSLQNSSGNVANATATATLAAAAGVTTHLSGFEITGGGATVGSLVSATVTGLLGGTATYTVAVSTGATVGNPPLVVEFDPPLPASAANTAIAVSVPALGAGNTNSSVVAHGFQL